MYPQGFLIFTILTFSPLPFTTILESKIVYACPFTKPTSYYSSLISSSPLIYVDAQMQDDFWTDFVSLNFDSQNGIKIDVSKI